MSCNWSLVKLTDVACIITKKIDANQITKDCYISTENMQPYKRGVSSAGSLPSAAKFNSFRSGDTLFSNIRTYFEKVWLASFSGGASADVLIFRTKDESVLLSEYLYHFLSSPEFIEFTVRTSKGAKMPRGDKGAMMDFEFKLPPVEIQKIIACSLQGLERKVRLNSQTNQTLEQMAQAIFKSWFVDFDPVKAKMNGEQPEGMDAVTASLFPEKLVESELGLIPEGWEVGTLDSHTSMIIDHRGKTPKKLGSDWVEEGYPAISAKNIKSKKIVRPDTIRFIDEVTYKKWMKEPLINGDIIMTSEAPMGELYFFDGSQDFCLSQRLYGLRANSDVCSPEFLFNWLQTTKAKSDMEGRASGTTALGIKQAELRKVKILTPPRELLEKYSVVASNLVDMAAKNNAQNTILEDLRDTLLPKLLSGEIELKASA